MPKKIRDPIIRAKSRYFDSAGWEDYRPREDDIIIASYPKCGTTWAQHITGMMIFQSDAPFPVQDTSPWPDMRLAPPGAMLQSAESQTHRRFLKSHVPYDSLPIFEGVKIIHLARDGRDAAMSFHNHKVNYTDMVFQLSGMVLADDPDFEDGVDPTDPDPTKHFHDWIEGKDDHMGDPACGFWHMERSYWEARNEPDVLMVHYADLKKDLEGEMRRIAKFLAIDVPENLWPKLVEAASFDSMKKRADELLPTAGVFFEGGGNTLLHKGTNGRWLGTVDSEDLRAYDRKVKEEFSPELARWIEFGRLE